MNLTPMETLKQFCPGELDADYRKHLARFGISASMLD